MSPIENREGQDSAPKTLELTDVIKAAAQVVANTALDLIQADPHAWSERPCPTCRPIGALIGRPFGCYLYAQQRAAQRAREAAK